MDKLNNKPIEQSTNTASNLPLAVYQPPAEVREIREEDRIVQKTGKDGKVHTIILDKNRRPMFDPHPTEDQTFLVYASDLH